MVENGKSGKSTFFNEMPDQKKDGNSRNRERKKSL